MECTFSRSMTDVASMDMVVLVVSEEQNALLEIGCTKKKVELRNVYFHSTIYVDK